MYKSKNNLRCEHNYKNNAITKIAMYIIIINFMNCERLLYNTLMYLKYSVFINYNQLKKCVTYI